MHTSYIYIHKTNDVIIIIIIIHRKTNSEELPPNNRKHVETSITTNDSKS